MKFDLRVSIAVALALLTAAPTAYAQSADLSDKLAAPTATAFPPCAVRSATERPTSIRAACRDIRSGIWRRAI